MKNAPWVWWKHTTLRRLRRKFDSCTGHFMSDQPWYVKLNDEELRSKIAELEQLLPQTPVTSDPGWGTKMGVATLAQLKKELSGRNESPALFREW